MPDYVQVPLNNLFPFVLSKPSYAFRQISYFHSQMNINDFLVDALIVNDAIKGPLSYRPMSIKDT